MYSEVTLKAITVPIEEMSAGEFIAYCARVSNPDNQNNHLTSDKLLKYLIRNKHWSPFEMVNMVLEIKTTRDIARQILRHRSFSFQEFSQRYAVAENFVYREPRLQDEKNRQNSIETDNEDIKKLWGEIQKASVESSVNAYNTALRAGIAKEQARCLLPEGNTVSTIYMNGTIRSWLHYCDLRCENGTQKEHMEVALKCREILYTELAKCKHDPNKDINSLVEWLEERHI